jgi:hypothetical protein
VISKCSVGLCIVGMLSSTFLSQSGLQCATGSINCWLLIVVGGLFDFCDGSGRPGSLGGICY